MYGQGSIYTVANSSAGIATGTFAERSGIVARNGDAFIQTDDARDSPSGLYYFVNTIWNYVPLNPEQLIYFYYEFFLTGGNNGLVGAYIWSITGLAQASESYANFSGTTIFSTGTSATGRCAVYFGNLNNTSNGIFITQGAAYYKCLSVDLPLLSTVGEEFIVRCGFSAYGAGGFGGDFDDGIYFEYNRLTSVNWLLRTARSGIRTTLDSGVPVATGQNLFEIFVSPTGSQADYYLNGTLIGSVLLVGFNRFYIPVMQIVKSAGIVARTIVVDYIKAWQRRSVTRV